MTTLTLYGHGSHFQGAEDPHDLDVLAVSTDEHLTREDPDLHRQIARCGNFPRLPVDISVMHPDLLDVFSSAVIHHGTHLAGPSLVDEVPPVDIAEWRIYMAALALESTTPGNAALNAIAAMAADAGRFAMGKWGAVADSAGTRWEELATAAWMSRHEPTFDHPDLEDALAAARRIATADAWLTFAQDPGHRAGWLPGADLNRATVAYVGSQLGPAAITDLTDDPSVPDWTTDEWAQEWADVAGDSPPPAHGAIWHPRPITRGHPSIAQQPPPTTCLTVYRPGRSRYALPDDLITEALDSVEEWARSDGADNPHDSAPATDQLIRAIGEAITAANNAWWRFDIDWYHGRLKRLSPGDRHRPHVDTVAIPEARKLSAVAMLSEPATFEGGTLSVNLGTQQALHLERGAIAVMPTWVLHEVANITSGERITAVVHGYGPAFR